MITYIILGALYNIILVYIFNDSVHVADVSMISSRKIYCNFNLSLPFYEIRPNEEKHTLNYYKCSIFEHYIS